MLGREPQHARRDALPAVRHAGLRRRLDVPRPALRQDLAAFEVWNEPDQANENYWAGPNKIANYVALTKARLPGAQAGRAAGAGPGRLVRRRQRQVAAGALRRGHQGVLRRVSVHFYDLTLSALSHDARGPEGQRRQQAAVAGRVRLHQLLRQGRPGVQDRPRLQHARGPGAEPDRHAALDPEGQLGQGALVVTRIYDQSDAYQFGLLTATGAAQAGVRGGQRRLRGQEGPRSPSRR